LFAAYGDVKIFLSLGGDGTKRGGRGSREPATVMPEKITAYRVFIASPGGLDKERKAFRAAINAHNESDAVERGVIFLPVGWEETPGGIGRPQAIINQDVRRCDYFMLVLHDRWGSAPQAGESPYSSGSEEEFDIARECHDLGTMREIVVLFKNLDPAELRDPGPQLNKVLEFRKHLENETSFLFEVFDELSNFQQRLRRHLAGWVRNHEREEEGQPPVDLVTSATARRPTTVERAIPVPRESGSAAVRDAKALAQAGHVTQAEQALARVMVIDHERAPSDETLEAMVRYGDLQLQVHSYAAAEEVFKQLLEIAREHGTSDWGGDRPEQSGPALPGDGQASGGGGQLPRGAGHPRAVTGGRPPGRRRELERPRRVPGLPVPVPGGRAPPTAGARDPAGVHCLLTRQRPSRLRRRRRPSR
jgi:hypothetical protein